MIYSSISNKHSFCSYKSPPTKHHKKYIFEIVPSFPLPYSRTTFCLKGEGTGWEGGPQNLQWKSRSKHNEMCWRSAEPVADTTPSASPLFLTINISGASYLLPLVCVILFLLKNCSRNLADITLIK